MTKFFEYLDDFGLGINEENKAKFLSEEKEHLIEACYYGSQMLPYEIKDKSEEYYNDTFETNKETLK